MFIAARRIAILNNKINAIGDAKNLFEKIVVAPYTANADLKKIADFACDGTQDQSEIQAAINMGRDVYLLPGSYRIFQTIVVKPGIHLELAHGATLNLAVDIDGVYISRGACLSGGKISSAGVAPYDHALVVFHGQEQFSPLGMQGVTSIHDIVLLLAGTYNGGTAIVFTMDESQPNLPQYAYGLMIHHVLIGNGKYGIYFNASLEDRTPHFFNGNIFESIYFHNTAHCIYAPFGKPAGSVAGNFFHDIQLQSGSNARRFIYINCHNNTFSNVLPWDWIVNEPCIEFGPDAKQNLVIGTFGKRKILDRSIERSNVVHDTGRQQDGLMEFNNGNLVTEW